MLRIFIGTDPRQPIAYSALSYSIARHASVPVSITPLVLSQLPITRRGLTEFTYSRFLVPYLCDYRGPAVFMDADIIVKGDIAGLFACGDAAAWDVQVMQEQERFEWASVMLFNCARCLVLTPEYVQNPANALFDFKWSKATGPLPKRWNQIVGYGPTEDAALYHYTRGIPIWPETRGNPEDAHWLRAAKLAGSTCTYQELMGRSIHHERAKAC